jgi:poly(3-hydroxybutyrate) depolymerase
MPTPLTYSAYDMTETMRLNSLWMGATAKTFWSNPIFGLTANPIPATFAAWGEVSERAFNRLAVKPDWGIDSVVSAGKDYLVNVNTIVERPFGRLLEFRVRRPDANRPKVLLIAPMSGHYATLLRNTVTSLLPNCDVFITEWRNARNVPLSSGKFDIEDFTMHLVDFFREVGTDTHIVAVCQPVPLTLAAMAWLSENEPKSLPASMTLIGGPVDPDANPTEVTDFGNRVTMGQLENSVIQSVGVNFPGIGRQVYPGSVQLASFIAMNMDKHAKAFTDQIFRVARGEAGDRDRHNKFYDEYLAVMDMPAEFYLSTVDRIFKTREIARNKFSIDGKPVDLTKITNVPMIIVEGGNDDISAPGQCAAALDLLSGLPDDMKAHHVEPEAGHYGIFSGRAWHENIRPVVMDFIAKHSK